MLGDEYAGQQWRCLWREGGALAGLKNKPFWLSFFCNKPAMLSRMFNPVIGRWEINAVVVFIFEILYALKFVVHLSFFNGLFSEK